MERERKVVILCGGRSAEHAVSLVSARNVAETLERTGWRVVLFYLGLDGSVQRLAGGPDVLAALPPAASGAAAARATTALPGERVTWGQVLAEGGIFFPVLHGPGGEDGTVQGLLELGGVPYAGCGVLASAVGMDKALTKEVWTTRGLPVVPHRLVTATAWRANPAEVIADAEAALAYPLFVKPAGLGSSVGISKVARREELGRALDLAARYDRRIVVEKGLRVREIEVAVLGNDRSEASLPGEIVSRRDFYDYEAKYQDGWSQMEVPASLDTGTRERIRALALEAYAAIDGAGLARVDFFLTPEGEVYLNEINTIPGFTRFSMYPVMWEKSGLPWPRTLEKILALGWERWEERRQRVVEV